MQSARGGGGVRMSLSWASRATRRRPRFQPIPREIDILHTYIYMYVCGTNMSTFGGGQLAQKESLLRDLRTRVENQAPTRPYEP